MSTPPLYDVALAGFREAHGRLTERLETSGSATPVLLAAMEAAYWANAIEGRLWKDDPKYAALKGAGPELMSGLRYVRNRSAHQLPMVVEKTGGLRVPFTVPFTIRLVALRWVAVLDMPPPDPRHPDPRGEAAYVARLEGRRVGDVMYDVDQWLMEEQRRPGSLLPPGNPGA